MAEEPLEAFIPHVADSVQCKLRRTLANQNGLHDKPIHCACATKVVYEACVFKDGEGAQRLVTGLVRGIVVVAVDDEEGQVDVDVRVLIVGPSHIISTLSKVRVAPRQHFELNGAITHAVLAQEHHDVVHGSARRFVVVEDVAAVDPKVDALGTAEPQSFLKGEKAILATHGVALQVPAVIVGKHKNSEQVPAHEALAHNRLVPTAFRHHARAARLAGPRWSPNQCQVAIV